MYFSILNEKMNINFIAKILKQHSIPFFIKSDEIFADSMIAGTKVFEEVENVTNFTVAQLRSWLGY